MSSESMTPGSPRDWLRHSQSNMALARQDAVPDVLYTTLCFHAQQAAEMAVKAVMVAKNVDFPYTHNLAVLTTILAESGVIMPGELDEAADLTIYAAQLRYPGLMNDIMESDYREALSIAESVIEWAEKLIT